MLLYAPVGVFPTRELTLILKHYLFFTGAALNIYILKFVAATTNIFVISYAVGYFPSSLSSDYMLSLAYTVLGTIVVGVGIDVCLERYAVRVLTHISKFKLTGLIVVISLIRCSVLIAVNEIVNALYTPVIETTLTSVSFVFCTCLFLTFAATLNGVHMYLSSAIANVVRGLCRLPILLVPLADLTLPLLISIEVAATLAATTYCLSQFRRYKSDRCQPPMDLGQTLKFMSWNWLARLASNLSALNTVKILVLRSDDVNAVFVAYIIQLAQSVERFLPSKVLAGRYRPALAQLYDRNELTVLRREMLSLSRINTAISAAISASFIIFVALVFYFYMPDKPANFYFIVIICSGSLFLLNGINSVNIFSNVTEESQIIFLSSLIMGLCFITTVLLFDVNNSERVLTTLFFSALCYFPVWSFLSRLTLGKILFS